MTLRTGAEQLASTAVHQVITTISNMFSTLDKVEELIHKSKIDIETATGEHIEADLLTPMQVALDSLNSYMLSGRVRKDILDLFGKDQKGSWRGQALLSECDAYAVKLREVLVVSLSSGLPTQTIAKAKAGALSVVELEQLVGQLSELKARMKKIDPALEIAAHSKANRELTNLEAILAANRTKDKDKHMLGFVDKLKSLFPPAEVWEGDLQSLLQAMVVPSISESLPWAHNAAQKQSKLCTVSAEMQKIVDDTLSQAMAIMATCSALQVLCSKTILAATPHLHIHLHPQLRPNTNLQIPSRIHTRKHTRTDMRKRKVSIGVSVWA